MSGNGDRSRQNWLIYALGGGWGHLNRALALGRIAARRHGVTILTNSAYVDYVCEPSLVMLPCGSLPQSLSQDWERVAVGGVRAMTLHLAAIAPDLSREETCDRVRQFLLNQQYDCLIVDTFPRGLGGELADLLPQLQMPRILIHRDLNPRYVQAKGLAEFVECHFEQVLVPGEDHEVPLAHLPQVQHTAPWLIRSADELMPPDQARSLLRLPPNPTQVVIICASGSAPPFLPGKGAGEVGSDEAQLFGTLTYQLHQALPGVTARCLAPECPPLCPPELWIKHWPGMDCLQMANVVVGGAGYNTTYECAALKVPLISFAFRRLYDRQARRAQRHNYEVHTVSEAIALVQHLLQQLPKPASSAHHRYINGALQAVQLTENLIR